MDYWSNKGAASLRAKEHTERMERRYKFEIEDCVNKSVVYGEGSVNMPRPFVSMHKPRINPIVVPAKTDEALFGLSSTDLFGNMAIARKPVILNFASYKNPGGRFMDGSMAQEEALCHKSFLYNVLVRFGAYYDWNKEHLNRGLYLDRAIYTPNVVFFNADDTKTTTADVLTCAAPNRSVMLRYKNATEEENLYVLKHRVEFIRDIIGEHNVNVIILGAWGCGVFKQDPTVVSRLLSDAFANMETVMYAIPGGENLKAFLS